MQWPVLNPAMLFESMVRAEAFELLQAPGFDWSDFWARAKKEDWGMQHPVHDLSLQARMKSVGITFHGDEGQAKRHRNVLILSWSSIAIHGPSLLTKFPYCVPWHCESRINMHQHPAHWRAMSEKSSMQNGRKYRRWLWLCSQVLRLWKATCLRTIVRRWIWLWSRSKRLWQGPIFPLSVTVCLFSSILIAGCFSTHRQTQWMDGRCTIFVAKETGNIRWSLGQR